MNGKFKMINSVGDEIEYDVLFTFDSDETNKSYIVYTDNTKDSSGNTVVYASIYNPNDLSAKFEDIKTQKEWDTISDILNKLETKIKNGEINNNESEE